MSDHNYADPKLNRFMAAVKPEIRDFFNWLVRKEGYERAVYVFEQALAELVVKNGLTAADKLVSK